MAIYHLHMKVIGRSSGASAVAAAAYRSASRLRDDQIDRAHDFTAKRGVVHSEVLLPEGAPDALSDRERLWNEVEASEVRRDAQLARELEFALPREMTEAQAIDLARDFVQAEFVDRGMIADLNVHWDRTDDGLSKPHSHVMLTMRSVDEEGFGHKVRDWNRTDLLERWRERWAEFANERLAELDIDARIDHRSFDAQGIALEPQDKIGAPAQRIVRAGHEADRVEMHREIARENGTRIIADPGLALDAIIRQQATFTRRDMAVFAHRHSDGPGQFDAVLGAMRRAPDLVALGQDVRGQDRFTTRDMLEAEQRLHRAALAMAERELHAVGASARDTALARAEARGLILSAEQAEALAHVTDGRDLEVVIGHAGTGKSAMLGVAREAWEAAGYRVRGAALSGIAAENLEGGSGIGSRTIASLEQGWAQGRDALSPRDILVIDEAGMVGTRQLERVLSQASDARAKVVLVGDPQQLQSIEAGAAFRSLHDLHGGARIGEVRRQREAWQREATRDLATGRTEAALAAYEQHGHVHAASTRATARDAVIEGWDRDRRADPEASRIILTHTNDEVRALNEVARVRMREAGDLGAEVRLTVERGERSFAPGDRVMFLQNDRGMGVKNGTLGTVEALDRQAMTVCTGDGRAVRFDLKDYDRIDHGYAATIHKAQGMTVNRAHVLATPGLDAHASYVALTRHRDGVDLHYGCDDFASPERLARTLGRERAKDMALDHAGADPADDFAARRGINFGHHALEPPDLSPQSDDLAKAREAVLRPARARALIRHAEAVHAVFEAKAQGDKASPEQVRTLNRARDAFEALRPDGWRDAEAAYVKDPALARDAAKGKLSRAIRALQLETELRTNPRARADRFVERLQTLDRRSSAQYRAGDYTGYHASRKAMTDMARSLQRDPQLESLLANRKRDLGISNDMGRQLGQALAFSHGLELGHSRGLGL